MKKIASTVLIFIIAITTNGGSAYAGGKDINVNLDFTKSAAQSLQCAGISIPITYTLISAKVKSAALNVKIYDKGKFQQTLKMKIDENGVIKFPSGQLWYGTSNGNPMTHAWYVYPIKQDPQELCSQMKSDVAFAKSRYTAYKTIVAVFVLPSQG